MRTIAGVSLLVATLPGPWAEPIAVSVTARSIRVGELVVLKIVAREPVESLRVRAFDRDLAPFSVDPATWRVLVGIDLDVKPGTHAVTIEAGSVRTTYRLAVKDRRFPTRRLTVDDSFVNPPPDALERIQREAAELNQLWESSAVERFWDGPFLRPVEEPATSAFGTRSFFNEQPRAPHSGADFRSPAGTPVHAPNAGRVVLAGERYLTGNTVILDHGLGTFSLFAHLATIAVAYGDRVKAGDLIGEVGATGRVTGPHLHWAVRVNGARVDPLSLLSVLGDGR